MKKGNIKKFMAKTKLRGKVISNKMARTVVVEVERWVKDPTYKKIYKKNKKYKSDVGQNKYNIGDKVEIELCSPISKDKKWRVIKKISS